MKYGLGAFGILLVLLGAAFFYIPTELPTSNKGTELMTAYQLQALAPKQLAIGAMILGAVLLAIAWFLPTRDVKTPNWPYETFRSRLGGGKKSAKRP